MKYGQIPNIDKPISRLVQGTAIVNFRELEQSMALLDEVFELGCTTIDTAHGYGNGESERFLGHWLNKRGLRDRVVILSKGAHHNQDRQRVTPYDITSDLFDSLARLQTDYIDLYLLHRDDPSVPVGPIVELLNEHKQAGRIKAFGGSNWTPDRIRAANDYAKANNLTPFSASSPNFSLAEQVKEPWPNCITISGPAGQADRDWYSENQMPLFTWSSMAGGFFTGRFNRSNLDSFDTYFDKLCVESYCSEDNFIRLDRARLLAEEKELTLPQIAVAYILSQPLNIFALIGCNSGAEFKANLEASEIQLTPEESAWLDLRSDER